MHGRRGGAAVVGLLVTLLLVALVPVASGSDAVAAPVTIDELTFSDSTMAALRNHWVDQLEAKYGDGHWAPLEMTLDDADLALMGLPSKAVLTSHRYQAPTWFDAAGKPRRPPGGGGGGGRSGTGSSTPVVASILNSARSLFS